jgi:hypothetical protein
MMPWIVGWREHNKKRVIIIIKIIIMLGAFMDLTCAWPWLRLRLAPCEEMRVYVPSPREQSLADHAHHVKGCRLSSGQ